MRFVPITEETLSVIHSSTLAVKEDDSNLGVFKSLPFIAFSKACAAGIAEYANLICAGRFRSGNRFYGWPVRFGFAARRCGLGWSIVPTIALANCYPGIISRPVPSLPEKIRIGIALRADETDLIISALLDLAVAYFSILEK